MKNALTRTQLLTNGDMSTSSLTSAVLEIQYLDDIGVQLNFTGTPTGTFQVQVSADHQQDAQGNVTTAGNWVPITFSSSPVASGAAGTVYLDIATLSAPYLRVVYTRVSGSGTLNVFATGKSLSA